MDKTITVGMIVWGMIGALGFIGVIALLLYFAKIIAEGFNH